MRESEICSDMKYGCNRYRIIISNVLLVHLKYLCGGKFIMLFTRYFDYCYFSLETTKYKSVILRIVINKI
jgi:hypothetical protein